MVFQVKAIFIIYNVSVLKRKFLFITMRKRYVITRLLQFEKGKKPIVVETVGFFAVGSYMNFVMLQ
jgi:hypothetical protein